MLKQRQRGAATEGGKRSCIRLNPPPLRRTPEQGGNMAQIRHKRPVSGRGFQVKALTPIEVDPSSLGSFMGVLPGFAGNEHSI